MGVGGQEESWGEAFPLEGKGRTQPQQGSWQGGVLEQNEEEGEVRGIMGHDSENSVQWARLESREERRDVIRHAYFRS